MKRWIAAFLGLLVTLGTTAGCQQKCFISEKDFYDKHLLPPGLEDGDMSLVQPTFEPSAAPPTNDHPDRPARPLSMQEAFAIALENGSTGSKNGGANTPGIADDSGLINTGGSLNGQSDRLRVISYQPAIQGAIIEAALARFDAIWYTALNYVGTDNLPGSQVGSFNGQQGLFGTGIVKALGSGGIVSTSFETDYALLQNNPAPFNPNNTFFSNPNYDARVRFGFEQPLLRNFGSFINQVTNRIAPITSAPTGSLASGSAIPASAASAFANQQSNLTAVAGQPVEGILIARVRFDQQRAEFERQVHNQLINVEVAYWNLYAAYGTLYANEEVLRVLHKTWLDNFNKVREGAIGKDILAQIRGQFEEFRGERTNSLAAVLEAERNLRRFLGLPVEDGTRLVPVTAPTLAHLEPSWEAALSDAMTHRPELVLARENLRFHEMALTREKNSLKPDLRFVAQYQPAGFGRQLNGSGTFVDNFGRTVQSNAYQSLSSNHFNDYFVGLNLNVPLGFRFEHASVRVARLQLAQAYELLKDQEDKVKSTLAQQYQGLNKWYRLIEDRRAERRAYAEALKTKFSLVESGKKPVDLDLLDVQRRLALALTKEYQSIAEYNNAIARLEFARGTIMQHNNVFIAENGLTPCAQVRAVEHEKERSRALVLHEWPSLNPVAQSAILVTDHDLPAHLETVPSPAPMEGAPAISPEGAFEASAPKTLAPKVVEAPLPLLQVEPAFPTDFVKPADEAPERIGPPVKPGVPAMTGTDASLPNIPPLPDGPKQTPGAAPAASAPPTAMPPAFDPPAKPLPTSAPPFVAPPPTLFPTAAPASAVPPPVMPSSAVPPPVVPLTVAPSTAAPRPVAPSTTVAPPTPAPLTVVPSTPASSVELPPPPPIPDVVNDR